jgi:hypothetical protein
MVTWYGKTFQPARTGMIEKSKSHPSQNCCFGTTNPYPNELCHPELRTMLCSFAMLRARCEGSAPLLFRDAIIQAVLDSLTVQPSRSFGYAETVSKQFAVRVARFRMGHRGGMR